MEVYDVIIVGGGAAGFFAAINIAEMNSTLRIAILERGKEVLTKVKVSGGGRCNVTHAEFDPKELVTHYPRGEKELLGPFHKFLTGDVVEWFETHGVNLMIEEDGRMFPESNSSKTIIDCFLSRTRQLGIDIIKGTNVTSIQRKGKTWFVEASIQDFMCEKLLIATGSSKKMWSLLNKLGHNIVQPVPSLFTFDIVDERIKDIPGVVVQDVSIKVLNSNLRSEGPVLVTHVGLSAPAILKLSAFGALEFAYQDYKFDIEINFIKKDYRACLDCLKENKLDLAKKKISNSNIYNLPKRLWQKLIVASRISMDIRWAETTNKQLESLAKQLTQAVFNVNGKSTYKEEFVTAGGVDLIEIDFKSFESKLFKNLYLAGEVLNIDAVTGGFNFQNAWTGAFIAAKAISE